MNTPTLIILVAMNIATFTFSVIAPLMKKDEHLNLCIGLAIFASTTIMLINGMYNLVVISLVAMIRQFLAYKHAKTWTKQHLLRAAHAVAIVSVTATLLNYQNWASFWGAFDNIMCAYGFILLSGFRLRMVTLTHGIIWTCIGLLFHAPGVVGAASFMAITSLIAMYEMHKGPGNVAWLNSVRGWTKAH